MITSLATRGAIAESLAEVFEPLKAETLADTFKAYALERAEVERIAAMMAQPAAIEHFIAGNVSRGDRAGVRPETLFQLGPAIKALDATYWQRTLELTDILEAMPQARRDQWHQLVTEHDTPAFDEATVISTLHGLMAQRHEFFAERVDGVFRGLSGTHVTNSPMGFGKRMIMSGVYNGYSDWRRVGIINDLRCVIGRFMGRGGEVPSHLTSKAIEHAYTYSSGQWVSLDGGSMRLRMYRNGNAHIEVHPDMAWRLNAVLASIYPSAIPEANRRRPRKAKTQKGVELFSRPLPWAVLSVLARGRGPYNESLTGPYEYSLEYGLGRSAAFDEACDVLSALGGVQLSATTFEFDYPAGDTIRAVLASGSVPDKRAHQYYPTPRDLSERVIKAANILPTCTVLEPSAGQGALAMLVPKSAGLTMVEVAPLHCRILEARKLGTVVEADFLEWATVERFDRVVMNPPFSLNRWRVHLERAAELVAAGGRLVAVLPSAASGKSLEGWACSWTEPVAFPGTSIEVVILTAERHI